MADAREAEGEMGERDLGAKTSRMRDRDAHADEPVEPMGERGDLDGTFAEVLPAEAVEDVEDEDLAEARRADLFDVPEDDYVQDESADHLRGVIDPEPEVAAERIERDEREAHPRPKVRRPQGPERPA